MGQDGSGYTYDPDSDSYIVDPSAALPILSPTDTSILAPLTDLNNNPSSGLMTGPTPSAPLSSLGTTVQQAYAAATSPSSGGGFNLAAFMNVLAGGAAAGAKIAASTQSPYVIPGTSSIYNPATGQIMGLPADTSSLLLYGGVAIGAFVLISMLGKK
jgi:hypothetical protein